jgi:hypothetical protein
MQKAFLKKIKMGTVAGTPPPLIRYAHMNVSPQQEQDNPRQPPSEKVPCDLKYKPATSLQKLLAMHDRVGRMRQSP